MGHSPDESEEAARIAAALHDGPVQSITAARLRIEVLRSILPEGEALATLEAIDDSVALAADQVAQLMATLPSRRS